MGTVATEDRSRGGPVVEVGREVWRSWKEDRVNGLAAEVAFFAVLSVFPALLATAATVGMLEGLIGADSAERIRIAVLDGLEEIFTAEADQLVAAVDQLFVQASPGVLTAATIGALWAVSRGFAAIIRALNVAYNIDEQRGWVATRLLALGLALGSVVTLALVVGMLVVGPFLGGGHAVAGRIGLGDAFAFVWDWLRGPVAFAVLVAWAATIYHVAPNHRSPWRWDLPGAVAASVLSLVLSLGFRLYVELAAAGNEVLGVLGGALLVLIWLYLQSIALLLGGELNAVLARRHGIRPALAPAHASDEEE